MTATRARSDDEALLARGGGCRVLGRCAAVASPSQGQAAARRLISEGRVSTLLVEEINKIKSAYGRMNLDDLVARVYREYPAFTEKSQIRSRYF